MSDIHPKFSKVVELTEPVSITTRRVVEVVGIQKVSGEIMVKSSTALADGVIMLAIG